MGFHLTALEERAGKKAHLPPKNRVWNFFEQPPESVGIFPLQVLEPHQETQTCSTTTASGVRYYGFRYYSPENGRWLNRDPIGERGGVNLHAFNANNALLYIDVLGMFMDDSESELLDSEVWENPATSTKSYSGRQVTMLVGYVQQGTPCMRQKKCQKFTAMYDYSKYTQITTEIYLEWDNPTDADIWEALGASPSLTPLDAVMAAAYTRMAHQLRAVAKANGNKVKYISLDQYSRDDNYRWEKGEVYDCGEPVEVSSSCCEKSENIDTAAEPSFWMAMSFDQIYKGGFEGNIKKWSFVIP